MVSLDPTDYPNAGVQSIEYPVAAFTNINLHDTDIIAASYDGEYLWVLGGDHNRIGRYTKTGVYTGFSFVYGSAKSIPRDICWDGEYLCILEDYDNKVYKYTRSGIYTGLNFSVTNEDYNPKGMCWDGEYYWVVGSDSDTVYKYDSSGVYTGVSFYVGAQESIPYNIRWNGTHFMIVGSINKTIYYYDESGVYGNIYKSIDSITTDPRGLEIIDGVTIITDPEKLYRLENDKFFAALEEGDSQIRGIAFDGTYIWVLTYTNDNIYKFNLDGTYTGFSFNVTDRDSGTMDLCWDGTYLCVTGIAEDKIYRYTTSGTYVGSFSTLSQDTLMSMMTVAMEYYWVFGNDNDTVYKYTLDGTYTGTSFYIGDALTTIDGICWDGTHFWIAGNDKIYKYTSEFTAEGTVIDCTHLDFRKGLEYVNGKLLIGRWSYVHTVLGADNLASGNDLLVTVDAVGLDEEIIDADSNLPLYIRVK